MPAVFTGRWTRGTILNQAFQRVGNKKIFHLGRDRLNRLLEELYTQWEWPFLYKEYDFTFPAGNTGGGITSYASFQLPNDFLKTESESTGLRVITMDGNVVDLPVMEVDPIQFRRRAVPHDLTGQRPLLVYFAYSTSFAYFWPAPTSTCAAALFYKFLPTDVSIGAGTAGDATTTAYDADIPLFPWGGFLAMAMEVWGLEYEHSERANEARQECWGPRPADKISAFEAIRNIAMPRASQEQTQPLDPQVFGPAFRDESWRYFRDWDWWT